MATSHRKTQKLHDTLGRRRRDTATSRGELVRITPRDLLWFEALHRHGPLPLPYLHAFTHASNASYHASTRRAATLFHEGYLTRPHQQFATLDARCQTLVYDLSGRSKEELRRNNLRRQYAPKPSPSHWRHDFMVACITASIEISTAGTGCGYIHRDEILNRNGTTLSFDVSSVASGRDALLRPDSIFGIRYPSGRARLVVVEADCGTEVLAARGWRKSIERNAGQYRAFIGERRYREALGTDAGILLLYATTSPRRMSNLIDVWRATHDGKCPYAIFACLPEFVRYFKPPQILTRLFTAPYERIAVEPFHLDAE